PCHRDDLPGEARGAGRAGGASLGWRRRTASGGALAPSGGTVAPRAERPRGDAPLAPRPRAAPGGPRVGGRDATRPRRPPEPSRTLLGCRHAGRRGEGAPGGGQRAGDATEGYPLPRVAPLGLWREPKIQGGGRRAQRTPPAGPAPERGGRGRRADLRCP